MCDQATTQAIELAVQDKVSKNEMFTAYDISRAARDSSGLRFRHSDVKFDVHNAISALAPSYLRTPIQIPNIQDRPFLYYPQGSDPNTYPVAGQSVVTAVAAQQPAALNPAPIFAPASNDPDTAQPDNRGRVWIPARFLSGMGVQHQQTVYVTQTTTVDAAGATMPALRITTATPAGATEAVEYLVDRHANIAITKGVFVDAGMSGQPNYKIEGTATEVVVKVV